MANTLDDIIPKLLARGLLALREMAVMPRIVNLDYGADAARKGQTIDVPIPSEVTSSPVVPAEVPPAPQASTPTTVPITLDNWQKADFYLTDKDIMEIDRQEHFLPMQTSEAVRSLANDINRSVHQEYVGIYGLVGVPGSIPFSGGTVKPATQARKVLNQQRAPKQNRRGVLDFDAEAAALELQPFSDADKVGSSEVKIEGEIGRKFGIDWFSDDEVQTHTAGTITANVTVTGAEPAGDKVINVTTDATGAVALVVGDIIRFAGDSQTYVVTAPATIASSSAGDINIEPGLVLAKAGGEAVTAEADHVVNLAFHRDAFALAIRPLAVETDDLALGSRIMSAVDPQTGLVLRIEVSRQYKQTVWEYDVLWGAKLVRRELAVRIAGDVT